MVNEGNAFELMCKLVLSQLIVTPKQAIRKVRLTQQEQNWIHDSVEEVARKFDFQWEEISLFGSRTRMDARGGDIDLYVKLKPKEGLDFFRIRMKLNIALQERFGERKIDLVIDDALDNGKEANLGAFVELLRQQKVILWKKDQKKIQ